MSKITLKQIYAELGVTNKNDALEAILTLKLGYQPWRDRRGELLSKPSLTDAERQELKEVEDKLMPLGWRASFGHSHEDIQAMEIIRKAANLIKNQ